MLARNAAATSPTAIRPPSTALPVAEPPAATVPADGQAEQAAPLAQAPGQTQQYPIGQPPVLGAANGTSTTTATTQPAPPAVPQYPPGVKVPVAEQAVPGSSQQVPTPQSIRPPSAAPQQIMTQQQRGSISSAFPGSLSDLVISFENVKQKAPHRMSNLDQVHKLLEGSYSSMPQPQDTEKPKYYVPRNPFQTPAYYPQHPNPILNTAAIFSQLDVETLFYVFYFHPGTYQQYLAAKELKRQSWRFHVKYLTWFQRHSEPQAITEEYEQGVYVYFDWEGSWCQRKKSDFRFEYRYLSED
ncbi:hypothetical protein NM688_g4066 [Phlebia brevispora]|uniref:Uncharacterized protein n=1 Tax=Phlebia brevispora TaxID=194682 RepID=A0ACC1T3P4_9APHY|nr:hypothetical protein NM688_g4066 [Phlebia brevispora]